MAAATTFNNIILGQFVLTGVPVKVYTSNRFLILTDVDDVEDPSIGFGMDENGEMIQFEYPEVQFIQINGNKVDIATYNKGMAALYGDEPIKPESPEDEKTDDNTKEDSAKGPSMSDHYVPKASSMKLKNLIKEISQDEVDAEIEGAKAQIDAAKAQPIDDSVIREYHGVNFGTGDLVNNTNTNCVHYGSKGIVIQIPYEGYIRYTVTNSGDSFKPGDILTKTSNQLEKI